MNPFNCRAMSSTSAFFVHRMLGLALFTMGLSYGFEYNKLYYMKQMPVLSEKGATDSAFFFDSLAASDSRYARLSMVAREGGLSDLEIDPSDPSGETFFAVNDRGLNVSYEPQDGSFKVFAFPHYHQKLVHFKVQGDSLEVLGLDSILTLDSNYANGLPSTKSPTGEVALTMNRTTGTPDTMQKVPASADGYDFEGLRLFKGKFYLSDEYGPFMIEVDSASLTMTKEWYPGHGLPNVLARRRANRGMEGLAVTPSGKLVGLMQSPMYNPDKSTTRDSRVLRLVWLNPDNGEVKEYAYITSHKGSGRKGRDIKTGSMTAIDENRFVVIEHGKGSLEGDKKYWIDLFLIDISQATNVSLGAMGADPDSSGKKWGSKTLEELGLDVSELLDSGVVPVQKDLLLGDLLNTTVWPSKKPEGLAIVNDTTLVLVNDNDYGMTDYDDDGIPHLLPAAERTTEIMYLKVPDLYPDSTQAGKLTLLHNNDGESKLLPYTDSVGAWAGAARFRHTVDSLRTVAQSGSRDVVTVSSGDNFLAGKEWSASLNLPVGRSYYDAVLMDQVGYDAVCLGNHDFDFGPNVLAYFIQSYSQNTAPYLSANLDFTLVDTLKQLVDKDRLAKSVIVSKNGRHYGLVGATTPMLPFISSPGAVVVDSKVATAVQAEVNHLLSEGVNQIILISHLQSVEEDKALAPLLDGVDIVVAGGGDDLLGNAGDALFPGDSAFSDSYPIYAQDASGKNVPIVTTAGEYKYVGQLVADFDAWGMLDSVRSMSGPVVVKGSADSLVQQQVEDSVAAYIASLETTVIGKTQVGLDGVRAHVRSQETNLGDLLADALLWKARALATTYGVDSPQVALQNGGSIRNNNVIAAGEITAANTFDIAPFTNLLSVVEDVPVVQFKEILENAVSRVSAGDGRFAQVAGFQFVWDSTGSAQILDDSLKVSKPGSRIWHVELDNGTVLVDSGVIVDSSLTIDVAVVDFLARGGDQYPFRELPVVGMNHSYQATLQDYIQNGLDSSMVRKDEYPEAGLGRIHLLQDTSHTTWAQSFAVDLAWDLNVWQTRQGFYLDVQISENGTLQILKPNGAVVVRQSLTPGRLQQNLFLPGEGIYLMHIRSGSRQIARMIQVIHTH